MMFLGGIPNSWEISLTIPALCLLNTRPSSSSCFSSISLIAVSSRKGWRCVSLLGSKPLELEMRWMARLGSLSRGDEDFHNFEVYFPSLSKITFPPSSKSRSNHVCHNPPPYKPTQHCSIPFAVVFEIGFNLKQGLSVCAPTSLKPVLLGLNLYPTVKAIRVVKLRVK